MRSFLNNVMWKIRKFMYGRYGVDKLSTAVMWWGLFFYIASLFGFYLFFRSMYFICMLLFFFRSLSKNISKRRNELYIYEQLMVKPRQFIKRQKNRWRDRKTHKYFKCKCGAFLKVPRGKGKIEVSCRLCQRIMIKKT